MFTPVCLSSGVRASTNPASFSLYFSERARTRKQRFLVQSLAIIVLSLGIGTMAVPQRAYAGPEGLTVVASKDAIESIRERAKVNPILPKERRPEARKASTIGHEILNGEIQLGTVMPEMYQRLDSVIEEVKVGLGPRPKDDPKAMRAYAQDTLKRIDSVMISKNFVYPPSDELTLSLSKALTPMKLEGSRLSRILAEPANSRRVQHIQNHSTEDFFLADCDTASFVYLAVGEALDLPLFLVEVPLHNFVRWYFSDTDYINWETMYGRIRTDQEYISGYGIPQASITNGAFLSKFSRETTLGYCQCIVAMGHEELKRCKEAQDAYRNGVKAYNRQSLGWNNLAWSLTTCRDAAHRDGKEAVKLATKGVEIYASGNNMDTLACAYAEAGDFAKAIEAEEKAIEWARPGDDVRAFRTNLAGFRQNKTWIQIHPEDKKHDEAFFFGHR